MAEGAEASAKLLVSAARSMGNGDVMTFGTSMGAYGALLYAALGGADKCMAFGAEVILDLPGSRSALHKTPGVSLRYSELLSAIRKSHTAYYLYVSETDDVDMINAVSLLKVDRVCLFSVRGTEHPGVQALEDDVGVGKLIDAMFNDDELLKNFERKGLILERSELIKDLWVAFGLMREKNFGACLDYLVSLKSLYSDNSVFMFRLGEAYYRNKLLSQAVECWEKSIELDDLQYGAYNLLGSVMRRLGRIDEAKILLEKSIEINPRNPYPYHNLGRVYQDVGEVEKAIIYFQGAVDLNAGNKDFASSLLSIKQSVAII